MKLFEKKEKVEKVELTEEEKAEKKAMIKQTALKWGKTIGCVAIGAVATLGTLVAIGGKSNSEGETGDDSEENVSENSEE